MNKVDKLIIKVLNAKDKSNEFWIQCYNEMQEIINGNYLSKVDKYFNSFYEKQESILDYLNDKYIICIKTDDYKKRFSKLN